MRTIIAMMIGLSLIVAGCSDKKAENDLQKRNQELTAQLAQKDQFIEDMTSSMGEIHDRLESVWAKEKNVMRQASKTSAEGKVAMTPAELKAAALSRINDINTTLARNRKQLARLQARLDASETKYKGLQTLLDDLKTQLAEREQSVADLQTRVQNLQDTVTQQTQIIAARDATIEDQKNAINLVYYLIGSEDQLEKDSVITDEGGFPWGLFGSTTVLTSNFDEDQFQTLDRTKALTIEVPGTVDELVPQRSRDSYSIDQADGHATLHILKPGNFWRQEHLVIVTKKGTS